MGIRCKALELSRSPWPDASSLSPNTPSHDVIIVISVDMVTLLFEDGTSDEIFNSQVCRDSDAALAFCATKRVRLVIFLSRLSPFPFHSALPDVRRLSTLKTGNILLTIVRLSLRLVYGTGEMAVSIVELMHHFQKVLVGIVSLQSDQPKDSIMLHTVFCESLNFVSVLNLSTSKAQSI